MTTHEAAPTRVPEIFGVAFGIDPRSPYPAGSALRSDPGPADAPRPAGLAAPVPFAVRRNELDPMGHVNNAVYLDWAEEAVATAARARSATCPARWRLEFLGAAGRTPTIGRVAWPVGALGWACLVIDDLRTGERFVGATLVAGDERRWSARESPGRTRRPHLRRRRTVTPVTGHDPRPGRPDRRGLRTGRTARRRRSHPGLGPCSAHRGSPVAVPPRFVPAGDLRAMAPGGPGRDDADQSRDPGPAASDPGPPPRSPATRGRDHDDRSREVTRL